MKKTFTYFRTLATLLFAGAMTFSCALNEEPFNEPDQPVMDGPKVYTLTITAGNAATKALNVDGNTGKLLATWGAKDSIKVVSGTDTIGTLYAQSISSNGKTASFSGSLSKEVVKNDDVLVLWYNKKGYSAFGSQDGTLASAAEHDCAKATVTVESIDDYTGHVTLKEGTAIFKTQTAVLKLNLTTDGTSPLNATKLTLAGSFTVLSFTVPHEIYSFSIPDATYVANGNGVLYFALPDKDDLADKVYDSTITIPGFGNVALKNYLTLDNIKDQLANTTITVTATCGGVNCTGSVSGYPFTKNNYYTATLTLTPPYYAAMNSDIGKVIATDGNIYANKDAAEAAGTTAEAMIAYVGRVEEVCEHGLAISLTDVYEFQATLAQAQGDYIFPTWNSSSHAVTGATWHLPTIEEWQYMLWGKVITESTSIASFQTLLEAVGEELADVNPDGVNFWTNTPGTSNTDYQTVIYHRGDFASVQETNAGNYCHVRACLAF